MVDWKTFTAGKRAPCSDCGTLSPRYPEGWIFRYVSIRGQGKRGPKVRSERLCGVCAGSRGINIGLEVS